MTALVDFGHVTEKSFPLNNFRTTYFHFFCGDERYVALTLIGDLAERNFAEKHHII